MPAGEVPLRFRPFEPADVHLLGPWLRRAGLGVPHGVAAGEWGRRLIADPRIVCRVGIAADGVARGFYRLDVAPDASAEITLIVDPGSRRRGIGGQLLDDALRWGRERGLRRIVAVVREQNRTALDFFLACGFAYQETRIPEFVHLERRLHTARRQPPIEIVP